MGNDDDAVTGADLLITNLLYMVTKWNADLFKDKILELHRDKCDEKTFSRLVFKNLSTKVELHCKTHGWFKSRPDGLLKGCWCYECGVEKRRFSQSEFEDRVKSIHPNRLHSQIFKTTVFTHSQKPVILNCKDHGPFKIRANLVLAGQWCKKCADELSHLSQVRSSEQIMMMIAGVHLDKMWAGCFVDFKYINGRTLITLNCKTHGSFKIRPDACLAGAWCKKCATELTALDKKLSFDEFKSRILKIHNSKCNEMTFAKAVYVGKRVPVQLNCIEHGPFEISPEYCFKGGWCHKCCGNSSCVEMKWLDDLQIPQESRQTTLVINGKRFFPDAFDVDTLTIYEFLGDFWHGNPKKFKSSDIHPMNGQSYGDLYNKTVTKLELFEQIGYNVKWVWESDYKEGRLFSEVV